MLRDVLFKLNVSQHQMSLCMPHILIDGWSLNILIDELQEFYRAQLLGDVARVHPRPLQNVDYAIWQEGEVANGKLGGERDYWLAQLANPLPVLNLPTDFPRQEVQTFNGDTVRSKLGKELLAQIKQLAVQEDVSLFMILFAAYSMMLHNVTKDPDLIIATGVANRTLPDLETMLGFAVNT